MPLKLTFTIVVVLGFSRKPAGGTAKISCSPSKAVAKAMKWGDTPEWLKSSTPVGKLTASIVEFIPNKGELQKHAFQLDSASGVRDFEIIRIQTKKGKDAKKAPTYRLELHCSVDFTDSNGGRKLESYMQSVDESSMRVTYEKEAEQEELPMASDEQRQAVLEGE